MNKELEILRFIETRLERKQSVVLLIVVQSSGSSPGRPGFKMVVTESDELYGSIGGGLMEVNLVGMARKFLSMADEEAFKIYGNTNVFTVYQDHRKDRPFSSGMICSGKQRVIFFKIEPAQLENLQIISNSLTNHTRAILQITQLSLQIITPEMNQFNDLWNSTDDFYFVEKERQISYLEKLGLKNKLFIIGGGHCALALSEMMSRMDFHISLFDDRADLNTVAKNKFVHEKKIIASYEEIADFIDSGKNVYVVVMTLGYKFDEIVIRRLLDKDFKYFGVLGSRAKMKTLLKNLEKEGLPKQKLAALHTPVGLPINSRTPEEIAVSIAAEIIAVKNKS